jgi:hypothetical protein
MLTACFANAMTRPPLVPSSWTPVTLVQPWEKHCTPPWRVTLQNTWSEVLKLSSKMWEMSVCRMLGDKMAKVMWDPAETLQQKKTLRNAWRVDFSFQRKQSKWAKTTLAVEWQWSLSPQQVLTVIATRSSTPPCDIHTHFLQDLIPTWT